jgi:hypothetical protein
MGTKSIHTGDMSPLPLLYEVLEATSPNELLEEKLLANLSTSGAGDFNDVSELVSLIHQMVQYALFVNQQEYDLDAAAELLLQAQTVGVLDGE